ncbi:hypothetical protein [Agrococcus jejuensis]|uniref:Uncharacterized protein n=1 Tax=Agrococcus jejuensis TaxID=399736 RepID=A0A1G8GXG1_9MICO|nr:hypothetical protein [Agrococcus jejuensis]SDH98920.1 hypothetical protein SAMN04489720_3108 [Agrococcus jejuensis]
MSAARVTRPKRPRPRLTLKVVLLLVAIAVLMPAVTALGSWIATLYAGPDGLLQTYQFQLCRRGSCLGDGIQRGPSEVATAGAILGLPWMVAAVGLGLSLLLRRRGWMTIPLTIVHVLFALTMWNQIAYAMAGGAWWGQIILVVFLLGLPLAMLGLGELAIPVHRKPKARTPERVALAQSDVALAAQASRGPAWQPPPAADPRLAGLGTLAQSYPKVEAQRVGG